ncbi:MAG: hypothetical protein GEU79_07870 [Acidimicrobiia bacterium]|nr:hypothetical protein [Acidimicrobiia bacterium]
MSDTVVVIVLSLFFGFGLWLLILSMLGVSVLPTRTGEATTKSRPRSSKFTVGRPTLIAAAAVGILTYLATAWPIAAICLAILTITVPAVFGPNAGDAAEIERIDGIATWVDTIRDLIGGASGLEQALVAAASAPPEAIGDELRRFAYRANHLSLIEALDRLGEELDHPLGDQVVFALGHAVRSEARDLSALCNTLSSTLRAEASMRRRIEVQQARLRLTGRIVVMLTIGVAVGVTAWQPMYRLAYDTFIGQMWLLLAFSLYFFSMFLYVRMSRLSLPSRFKRRQVADH